MKPLKLLLSITLVLMLLVSVIGVPLSANSQSTPVALSTPELETPLFSIAPVGSEHSGFFSDVPVEPGQTVELEASVTNGGSRLVELRVFVTNAHNGTNGGFQAGESEEEPEGQALWVKFPEQVFVLNPQEERVFPFTISIPLDADPGQYISALVVETTQSYPFQGSDIFDQIIRYTMSVGVLVPGKLTRSFELGAPATDGTNILLPITNTGNYLVRPEGEFTLINDEGEKIAEGLIELGSIYSGNSTSILISLPNQIESGEYALDLALTDPESETIVTLDDEAVVFHEPEDPRGIRIAEYEISPNSDELTFLNLAVELDNRGDLIPTATVIVQVSRDGQVIENFPLATNQLLLSGVNVLSSRYIPADNWESGVYTFRLIVNAVDPIGGQQTELLNQEIEVQIVVP